MKCGEWWNDTDFRSGMGKTEQKSLNFRATEYFNGQKSALKSYQTHHSTISNTSMHPWNEITSTATFINHCAGQKK